ncbi:superfamily I DNA/RNA helicase [Candidatus Gastranaerophilus sp. (ex Termes propinquus)]|nr:superfamily I DNA/RNA helicase [Candidatus Gastranaerophilus sp. (ex Termes propinquus)]
MLDVAKTITSAFSGGFIKRLTQYLHDCVREEVKSSTFRNLKGDKDNKWVVVEGQEELFTNFDKPLLMDGTSSSLTELMIQADMSQKEKYLIYGYLFLTGKSKGKKNNEFLTPLLYAPCRLERVGVNISCAVQEDMLSLNTGALAQLMKKEDEEEADAMLAGLLDVVPELPLAQESLDIFLTTLKSLVPELEIASITAANPAESFYTTNFDEDKLSDTIDLDSLDEIGFDTLSLREKTPKIKVEKLTLERTQAVILTKRPSVTAGVLHELIQIGEKSSGTMRENALNVINREYLLSKGKLQQKIEEKELKDFFPITPLSLSDSQEDVIKKIEENDFLAVCGPPGTGKSQTIVNLVAHLIAKGKTVLVASRMDKAVDIVAERLNALNAPYLALRAGRANYQKQLNFDLQDLLSNKVDLDSDYADAVLVDVDDMKELLASIKRYEDACEKIIKLEEAYTELQAEKTESDKAIGELNFIINRLTLCEIETARKIIAKLEKNSGKSDFFATLADCLSARKIKKLLKNKNITKGEMLSRLNFELDCEEFSAKLCEVENSIYKIGNLHQIMNKISTLKAKQKRLAVDILRNKRRNALKGLLSDEQKRQRLIVHAKSLVSKKQSQQTRLLENQDFKPLLSAFPCWCVTTYAVSNSLPLKSGMFDVVIIDEASQCDIASCFPLLYRAKKAVIVGDDKQLPHLSFLEKAKEQSFLNQYNIDDKYQLMWRFRTNSMFDLANFYSTSPVLLDEHFRSSKPIIEFSSQEFYGGRMKIMQPYFGSNADVKLVCVPDGRVDSDITRNMPECEALIKEMQDIIAGSDPKKPVSLGVISPFRGQVELIKRAVMQVFSEEIIRRHGIEVGTAHTFQGDEKDVTLISWAIAPNSHPQSLTFLQKPNLFNVAITRARKKVINFISKEPNLLPEGLFRNYINYIRMQSAQKLAAVEEFEFRNDFESEVFNELKSLKKQGVFDYEPHFRVPCAGVEIDILIKNIAIECNGVKSQARQRVSHLKKQSVLERSGFKVIRVTKREWDLSKNACLDRIIACL